MNLPETRLVRRFLTAWWAIFALITLNGCASDPEVLPVVCETKEVRVPYPVYRAVPDELTDPLPYPPGLESGFTVMDAVDVAFTEAAVGAVQDAAVAHEEPACGVGDDVTRGEDAVLEGHGVFPSRRGQSG
mgnify:CR=1 FL=1